MYVPRETDNNAYSSFFWGGGGEGANEVYYARCRSGECAVLT